jgi:hypothetical protein
MVHLSEIKDAEALGYCGAADYVARVEWRLLTSGEVAQESCTVVAFEVL